MDDNLFKNRLNQLGIGKQVNAAMVVARSEKIIKDKFGEHGADNLRVISYKNGFLKISASSSSWAAECQSIAGELKAPPVTRVVFSNQINQSEYKD